MKKLFDIILGPIGAVLVTVLASAAGVGAVFSYVIKPLLDAGYRWMKMLPYGGQLIKFFDELAQKVSDYWPPKSS